MPIFTLTSINQPEVFIFSSLTEAQLRNRIEEEKGIFIAESPKVIRVALKAGYTPLSLLCEEKHVTGDAADIISCFPSLPVYTGSRDLLKALTGYALTRGVLCAFQRPVLPKPAVLCENAKRIAVIDGVVDTTNIGAIFRSAAALGMDAVMLTRASCDPLNRRAVRVSMGTVFSVPWTWIDTPHELQQWGFKTAALALTDDAIRPDAPQLKATERLALILGTEGDGLSRQVIQSADYIVCIPMANRVDSLNVAAASAVAFWELTK